MNYRLEVIQRALEVYMESKRHIFPRFYFISNWELLEILGNSKNPDSIQIHLRKLFNNIHNIKIIVSDHYYIVCNIFTSITNYMQLIYFRQITTKKKKLEVCFLKMESM